MTNRCSPPEQRPARASHLDRAEQFGRTWRNRRAPLAPCGDERGSATLEMAILGPVLLLLTFAFVQAALYFHATNLVAAAAREGVSAGRSYGAGPQAGPGKAQEFLTAHAGDSVARPVISTRGTTDVLVRIEVTATALSILPGLSGPTVHHAAQAPRERYTLGGQP